MGGIVRVLTFKVRGGPLAGRPAEAEGRSDLDRNVSGLFL